MLNTKEVCSFISRLELLGFYELDDADSLYDFGEGIQEIADGRYVDLSMHLTHSKSVQFFEPYQKYLVRPMRKVVEFVETYNPGGFVPYQPDRLILFVHSGRAAGVDEKVKARQWDLETPVLHDLV